MENKSEFLQVAIAAAKKAGEIQLEFFGGEFEVNDKRASYDRVTTADLKSEEIIVKHIRNLYPEHNILAEENDYGQTDSEYTWVIDPLDGTNNFSCGIPIFASSIALVKGKDILCGVVYNPVENALFYAQKDYGAYLNDKQIHVNAAKSLEEALMITGFYYDRGAGMEKNLRTAAAFFRQNIVGLRRFGAAALDLCFVACGRAAAYWEFRLSPWDFAAGKLILTEAGGKISTESNEDVNVKEKSYVVSSNGILHDEILKIINSVD